MAKIGFIGTGEISSAMVRGLAGLGHQICVSERSAQRALSLQREFAEVQVCDNQNVLDESLFVVIALMKDVALETLPSLEFKSDHRVISVMVDLDMQALNQLCAPAIDISITIPLPFIAGGGCPLPVYACSNAVRELFGASNPIIEVASMANLNAHFAATAMASGMFAQMQELSVWLAGVTGDSVAAEAYVVSMLSGYLVSLPNDGEGRLLEALEALSTQGGLNATMKTRLDEAGVPQTVKQVLDDFRPRLGLPES